jgi:hypothetical protein
VPFGKGRSPDKPGTFRVRLAKDGAFRLSGVRKDGQRVRMGGLSESEANDLAAKLFPKASTVVAAVQDWGRTDDWGLPLRVSDETIGSVAQAFQLRNPLDPKPEVSIAEIPATPTPEEIEKKEKRTKNAKSLMDLVGVGVSIGDVMLGRKLCEAVDKDPVKPDPKHVNDLRENTREALKELFGDSEIEPWKMAILLALGIPLAMLIQSPRKKHPEKASEDTKSGGGALKSV